MTGIWVIVATLAAGMVVGLWLRAQGGRIRTRKGTPAALPEPVVSALSPETPVTLVQLSTTFCAPCRHARAVLSGLAERTDGLRHVDLDVTDQPDIAHDLGVLRTPTTLAFTSSGHELLRVSGVPKADELLEAVKPHLAARE